MADAIVWIIELDSRRVRPNASWTHLVRRRKRMQDFLHGVRVDDERARDSHALFRERLDRATPDLVGFRAQRSGNDDGGRAFRVRDRVEKLADIGRSDRAGLPGETGRSIPCVHRLEQGRHQTWRIDTVDDIGVVGSLDRDIDDKCLAAIFVCVRERQREYRHDEGARGVRFLETVQPTATRIFSTVGVGDDQPSRGAKVDCAGTIPVGANERASTPGLLGEPAS